jgi:hypothetical protein
MHMHPLTPRFIIAGATFVMAGITIAVTCEGVGEHAGIIGALVAALGVALIVSGVLRHWRSRDERQE